MQTKKKEGTFAENLPLIQEKEALEAYLKQFSKKYLYEWLLEVLEEVNPKKHAEVKKDGIDSFEDNLDLAAQVVHFERILHPDDDISYNTQFFEQMSHVRDFEHDLLKELYLQLKDKVDRYLTRKNLVDEFLDFH